MASCAQEPTDTPPFILSAARSSSHRASCGSLNSRFHPCAPARRTSLWGYTVTSLDREVQVTLDDLNGTPRLAVSQSLRPELSTM